MRALDTNVLVRYLTADDPRQTQAVDRLFEACERSGEQLFLSILVLCETAWVLIRCYKQTKPTIIETLERILEAGLFVVEKDDLARRSIEDYRGGKGDFSDYVIGNLAHAAGCSATVTFDRTLAGAREFTLLASK